VHILYCVGVVNFTMSLLTTLLWHVEVRIPLLTPNVPCWRYLLGFTDYTTHGCRGSICVATISLRRNHKGCQYLLRSSGFILRLANRCLGMDDSVDSKWRLLHSSVTIYFLELSVYRISGLRSRLLTPGPRFQFRVISREIFGGRNGIWAGFSPSFFGLLLAITTPPLVHTSLIRQHIIITMVFNLGALFLTMNLTGYRAPDGR
jgi:hypothetical protein